MMNLSGIEVDGHICLSVEPDDDVINNINVKHLFFCFMISKSGKKIIKFILFYFIYHGVILRLICVHLFLK